MDIRVRADVPNETVLECLRGAVPAGIEILEVYDAQSKLTGIAYTRSRLVLHTPRASDAAAEKIRARSASPILMMKKSKSGEREVDITALLRAFSVCYDSEGGTLVVESVSAAEGRDYLNPEYIAEAIARETDVITEESWHETTRLTLLLDDGVTEFH